MMDFNQEDCLDLMGESNKLLYEGKFLQDVDPAQHLRLTQYLVMIYDDLFWQSRDQYLQIIENFLNENIDVDQFIQNFHNLRGSNFTASAMREKNFGSERNVQLNSESLGFTKMISEIHMTVGLFNPEITLDMNLKDPDLISYGISEEFLKLTIKANYLGRIRKYCKKS